MKTKNMVIRDKILFILGMTLCGVFVFVLVMGVIIALLTSWEGNKRKKTIDSVLTQVDEDATALKAKSDE
jgi:hypothetical protein